MLTGCPFCIRCAFFWFNFSLCLTGCGELAVALFLKFAYEGYISLLPQYALLSADSILLIVGGLTLILAFFGCCGSWIQNRWLLITYFSCIILMFQIEIYLGALAFKNRTYLRDKFYAELKVSLKDHYNTTTHTNNSLVLIWDHVQTDLKCCGITKYTDWFNISAWPTEKWVPDSCCRKYKENCGHNSTRKLLHRRGCGDVINMFFSERLYIIGIIGLVVAFFQLYGLISSMVLFCTVKKRRLSQRRPQK